MAETPDLVWHDVHDWGVEGKAWPDTYEPYDRLPRKAKVAVPEVVWNLSRSATGMAALFETDAPEIHGRWTLLNGQIGEPNFPVAGFSGLDLYTFPKAGEPYQMPRWVGAGHLVKDQNPCQVLVQDMAPERRRFLVYFPARTPVGKVEIGVPRGSAFTPVAPRKEKPLVFYGTSIVHGAFASHAGMIHPAIIGRRTGVPHLNLGFSGNGKMELALADLLSEIDASVYILDCLPNMDQAMVEERAAAFVKRLREKRPRTPVIMVEDRPLGNMWIRPQALAAQERKWKSHRAIYESLLASGCGPLFYLEGRNLFGEDSEGSLDSSHPSDLGYFRMADALTPLVRQALQDH